MTTNETFANSAKTFLAAILQPTDLTLTVVSPTGFPTDGEFRVRIELELLRVTSVSASTWTVTRGAEGTSPAQHPQNARVTAVLTAGALAEMRAEIEAELAATVAAEVPNTRQVIAGTGLTGGGALSGDVTLNTLPTNQPSITALAAASGYSVGQSVWVTASAIFTSGASFVAVPTDKYPQSSEYVFNGQGVQWVELSTFMRLQVGPGIAL